MIIEKNKDIWSYYENNKNVLVIPTNRGWKSKEPFANVMGRGIALQCKENDIDIAERLGKNNRDFYIKNRSINIPIVLFNKERLLAFNTKALNPINPYMSWKHSSDLQTLTESFIQFDKLQEYYQEQYTFVFPQIGCGNGGLMWADVKDMVYQYLNMYTNIIVLENENDFSYSRYRQKSWDRL